MLSKLEEIIKRANPEYAVEYDELSMMNVRADEIAYTQPFAYIEEFTKGEYGKQGYFNQKTVEAQIWFCRFSQMQNTAREREVLRERIETEIIVPFMEEYKKESGRTNHFVKDVRAGIKELSAKIGYYGTIKALAKNYSKDPDDILKWKYGKIFGILYTDLEEFKYSKRLRKQYEKR